MSLCIAQTIPMSQPPDLIGSAETCDLLDIDRSTLTRWVAAGKVAPAVRLPGRTGALLFDRAVIVEMLTKAAS